MKHTFKVSRGFLNGMFTVIELTCQYYQNRGTWQSPNEVQFIIQRNEDMDLSSIIICDEADRVLMEYTTTL